MKPLRALVLVKPNEPNHWRDRRQTGFFSYAVPDFTWDFSTYTGVMNTNTQARNYDLIVHMDGAHYVCFVGSKPTIMITWDSTGSQDHYKTRFKQAQQCDLVLVDHDDLKRFKGTKKIVRRLTYCVNDRVFHDHGVKEKTNDIANHQNKGLQGHAHWQARNDYFGPLRDFVKQYGYSYREGSIDVFRYARSYAESRVAVNFSRTLTNRPHRTYDALAAGACLVTTPLPSASNDKLVSGEHYLSFDNIDQMSSALLWALRDGQWQNIAQAGYNFVHKYHTWAVRARELRALLSDTLGV